MSNGSTTPANPPSGGRYARKMSFLVTFSTGMLSRITQVVLSCWNLTAQWETFEHQKKYVFMLVSAISNKPLGITAL